MSKLLTRFNADLMAASNREDAAQILLHTLLGLAKAAMAKRSIQPAGTALRAVLCLRQGLAVQCMESAGQALEDADLTMRAGQLAEWSWGPLAVDVLEEKMEFLQWDMIGEQRAFRAPGAGATHLMALPLGQIPHPMGFVTVELDWAAQRGGEPVWWAMLDDANELIRYASPWLRSLEARQPAHCTDEPPFVVGSSVARLRELLGRFAPLREPIVLSGPAGVGKTGFAQWIHRRSGCGGDFKRLALAELPPEQQAELLPRALAEEGTLYIAEPERLSLALQGLLLEHLQRRAAAMRARGRRLVLGTREDLTRLVRTEQLNWQLWHAVGHLSLRIPGLDERWSEIPALAEQALRRCHAEAGGRGSPSFKASGAQRLQRRHWPENQRELEAVIRQIHARVLARRIRRGVDPLEDFALDGRDVDRALSALAKCQLSMPGTADAVNAADER